MIENNSMNPSEKIQEIASAWLYKVNVIQDCEIKIEDLNRVK